MVKLNKIYTRTGDDGTTGLVDGSRTPKHSPRVAAYGTVDEANAILGIARLHASGEDDRMQPEKRLFAYSIAYLFILFGAVVADHWWPL